MSSRSGRKKEQTVFLVVRKTWNPDQESPNGEERMLSIDQLLGHDWV